jgi:hypothetical protein
MKRKILVLMSALTFVTSTGCNGSESAAASSNLSIVDKVKATVVSFSDIAKHWAKGAIEKAIEKGYVDGYEDGTFRADNNVSRAEFIKLVVTALNEPVNGSSSGSDWATPYIAAAKKKGILLDADFPLDKINEPITRMEMSRIAVRATKKELQNPAIYMDDASFMYNATKTGLIQGLAGGELGIDKLTTRAQSVTIIERILSVNSGEKLPVDKVAIGQAELKIRRTNIFSMIPIFGGVQDDGHTWSPEKLVVETPDGKYKGEIDQVIAIDIEDSNDPNRSLLGDISELHWYDGGDYYDKMPKVKDYPKSYVILVQSHTVFNNDTNSYSGRYGLGLGIYGFRSPDEKAFNSGTLNKLTPIFRERMGDMAAYIVPKEGATAPMGINLKVNVPARPPVDDLTHTITTIQPLKQ